MTRLRSTLLLAMTVLTGCATFGENLFVPPVAPARQQRAADAVREFEDRRAAAQLQAAIERWQQGDAAGCESRLAAIVARRPEDHAARLCLAEVLTSRGATAEAETHLRAVLEREPDLAEAHHALGLLLEAGGHRDDARIHLSRAAELEPENEIFRLTADSVNM